MSLAPFAQPLCRAFRLESWLGGAPVASTVFLLVWQYIATAQRVDEMAVRDVETFVVLRLPSLFLSGVSQVL